MRLKNILGIVSISALFVGGVPIIPVGNGVVSWAEFEQPNGQVTSIQIPDEQYERMGMATGENTGYNANPASTTAKFLRAFQGTYEAQFAEEEYIEQVSSSSPEIKRTRVKDLGRPVWDDIDERVSILSALTPKAHAAIAFDASTGATDNSGLVTSITFSHTTGSGSDRYLVAPVTINCAACGVTISSLTYNAVAATEVDEQVASDGTDSVRLSLYILAAPATGANNVVATISGTLNGSKQFAVNAQTYTGAAQTGQPDSTGNFTATGSSAASVTVSTTVVASNTWLVGGASENQGDIAAGAAGAGTTYRGSAQFNMYGADSNGTVGTGSQSLVWGRASTGGAEIVGIIISLAPAVVAAQTGQPDQFIIFQ